MTDQTVDATVLIEDLTRALDGRYVVGDVLGFGRGGVTVRARCIALRRDVAIKVSWDNPLARARVQRETELTAEAAHPNVLPVHVVDEVERILVVEMPLAAGTVDDLLDPGEPVPFVEVISIMSAVAVALDQAHAAGIVHGGLRPVKLLRDAKGGVLVTDFALRVLETAGDVVKPSAVGSAAYTPNEQRHDMPSVDGRVDQFALAVIAYELLRGRRMWNVNADGVLEIDAVEIMPSRPLAPGVPLSVNTAIKRATSREPGFRYQTAGEFVEALSLASMHATPAEHIYRAQEIQKKRRSKLWTLVPLAALITAGAALKPQVRDNMQHWWRAGWPLHAPSLDGFGDDPAVVATSEPGTTKPSVRGGQSQADRSTHQTDNTRTEDSSVGPRGPDFGPTFNPYPKNVPLPNSGPSSSTVVGNTSTRVQVASPIAAVVGASVANGDVARRGASNQNADAPTALLGAVSVTFSGTGTATVVIDGVVRGRTPLVWEGAAGKHTISLRGSQSFSPESAPIAITGGDTVRVAFSPVVPR